MLQVYSRPKSWKFQKYYYYNTAIGSPLYKSISFSPSTILQANRNWDGKTLSCTASGLCSVPKHSKGPKLKTYEVCTEPCFCLKWAQKKHSILKLGPTVSWYISRTEQYMCSTYINFATTKWSLIIDEIYEYMRCLSLYKVTKFEQWSFKI